MTTKTKVTITITIILLIIAVGYIVFDEGSNYLNNQRGLYYQAGYQEGASYWNDKVTEIAREEDSLLYVNNQTEFKLTFKQLCEGR